jgi:hypothetical membrane protein
MPYERSVSICIWAFSAVSPVIALALVGAYGAEPPNWSAYLTVLAIVTWFVTAPWGVIRGIEAYVDERRWLGLLVSGASLAAIVLILLVALAKGVLG